MRVGDRERERDWAEREGARGGKDRVGGIEE